MTEEKALDCYKTFNDFWKFIKQYGQTKQSDDFWTEVVESSGKIVEAHGNSEFAKTVCYAVLSAMAAKNAG